MSRSYKKYPWVTDHKAGTTKNTKKFANKTVRHRKIYLMEKHIEKFLNLGIFAIINICGPGKKLKENGKKKIIFI